MNGSLPECIASPFYSSAFISSRLIDYSEVTKLRKRREELADRRTITKMIRTAACRIVTKLGSESLGLTRQNYFAASTIMMTASSNSSHLDKPALAGHGLRNDFCSPRRLVSTSSSGGGGGTDVTDGGGTEKKPKSPNEVTYVHPLSQIILEHFQEERSDWIRENNLERGLTILEDGSFVLVFPQDEDTKEAPGKIWYVSSCKHRILSNIYYTSPSNK
jgi:hypothetical protein